MSAHTLEKATDSGASGWDVLSKRGQCYNWEGGAASALSECSEKWYNWLCQRQIENVDKPASFIFTFLKKNTYIMICFLDHWFICQTDEKQNFYDAFIIILTRTAFKLKSDKECQLLTLLEQTYQL